ncbi:unnamed protein product [Cuscuta europaea]|uniref:Uncharacterized protein n=1 Tax=Cuscuta europaea TaxID=41803 RepID=A0A9P1DXH2_CUSEU|nr:unnamed protein product [Cuscuta europaea]
MFGNKSRSFQREWYTKWEWTRRLNLSPLR